MKAGGWCRAGLAITLFLNAAVAVHADSRAGSQQESPAPGYGELPFAAPEPGTYALPGLGRAANGRVLTSDGTTARLHDFLGDRVVLLSLIYTSCNDVNGCPLATFVMSRVRDYLQRDAELRDRVRLISLSFDPAHDTPAVMSEYAASFRRPGDDWLFLTTDSAEDLAPILEAMGQGVASMDTPHGTALAHVLRVYLIDRNRQIRNIYSVSFLHPEILISDIKTVLDTD